ncbi:MAG: ester cyclase [Rhodococcus sp. (in: high G+C Gram-positive bacteria)]|uniref:ester cyclase n=1 Tax=Rhodococcus sp. TaxID=1831 RepID=UPI003BB7D3DA
MGNSDIHRKLHGMFNDRDFDAMDGHLAARFTYEDVPRGWTLRNTEEFKGWLQGWVTAFPDARIDEDQFREGTDFSVATFHGKGRNDGPFGSTSPTGREMNVRYCEVMHIGTDGLVDSTRIYYDLATLLTQLGLLELPE